jgi:hypothetical protein
MYRYQRYISSANACMYVLYVYKLKGIVEKYLIRAANGTYLSHLICQEVKVPSDNACLLVGASA